MLPTVAAIVPFAELNRASEIVGVARVILQVLEDVDEVLLCLIAIALTVVPCCTASELLDVHSVEDAVGVAPSVV